MANATVATGSGTKRNNFNVVVTVDVAIAMLIEANIELQAVSGNGVTGVTHSISGSGTIWTITFILPMTEEGSFDISIVGMVTQTAQGSMPEAVMSNSVTVLYDTTTDIAVTFGTLRYQEGGIVTVPVNFAENVVAPSKTVFDIARFQGAELVIEDEIIEYFLVGENTVYDLVLEIPRNRSGILKITPDGYVLKEITNVRDNVVGEPILVGYDYVIPEVENLTIPVEIAPNLFQSVIEFDRVASHVQVGDFAYGVELADGGVPSALFRSIDFEVMPELPVLVNENDLTDPNCVEDWEYVSAVGPPWGVGRFFVLRFKRKSTDKRMPDLVLNQDSFTGYFDA